MTLIFRCPTCRQILDSSTLCCAQNHCFEYRDGVLVLLGEKTANRLAEFATVTAQMRREKQLHLLDPTIYETLPCNSSLQGNIEWRWRCSDVSVVKALVKQHFRKPWPLQVLDVGAYNGWLSHQLARFPAPVTAQVKL